LTPIPFGPVVFATSTGLKTVVFVEWTKSYAGTELSITYTATVDGTSIVGATVN